VLLVRINSYFYIDNNHIDRSLPKNLIFDYMAKKDKNSSVDKTLRECEAMVNYALSQGQKVPPHVLAAIEKFRLYKDYISNNGAVSTNGTGSRHVSGKPHPFELYSKNQFVRLGSNAAIRGEEVIDIYIPSEEEMVNELSIVHQDLVVSVSPATPATVCLLEDQTRKPLRFLGPVPLIQGMTLIAFFSLIGFLSLFLFDQVDAKSVNSNILDIKDPLTFVLNELVILTIAAAGASFYALFEAYKYIANASYDPKYESIYWIRFILGIMSGVILAQFIFIDPAAYGGDSAEVNTSQSLGGFLTYRPLLAFLGGFSARVVHKILNSLVDSLETFISGSARDMLRAREEQAKVEIAEKIYNMKRDNAVNDANQRFQSALKLMKLQEELTGSDANPEQLKFSIQKLIDEQLSAVGASTSNNNNNTIITTTTNTTLNENYIGPLPVVGPKDIDNKLGGNESMSGDMEVNDINSNELGDKESMPGDMEVNDVNTNINGGGVGGDGINIDLDSDAPHKE